MSQNNFIRRTCDNPGCLSGDDYNVTDVQQGTLSEGKKASFSHWIELARMFMLNGQAFPVQKLACSDKCALDIIKKSILTMPILQVKPASPAPPEEGNHAAAPEAGIDLEALRATGHEA